MQVAAIAPRRDSAEWMRSVLFGILTIAAAEGESAQVGSHSSNTDDIDLINAHVTESQTLLQTYSQMVNATEQQLSGIPVNTLNAEVLNTNNAVSSTLPKEYNRGANEFNQIALSAIFNNKQVNNLGARINKLRDHAEDHTQSVSFLSHQVSTTMANLQNAEEHFNFQIDYLTTAMTDMNTWYNRAVIVNQRQQAAIDYTGSLLNHLETTLTQTCDMMRGLVDLLDDDATKEKLIKDINDINAKELADEVRRTDNGEATQVNADVATNK
jgi:ribosomal protein S15P/S13E